MIPADTYGQSDKPDPVLDAHLVLKHARTHLPSVSAVTAVDESGGEARAYFIDDGYVFKTQRPHRLRPRTSLAKEVFFLTQLEQVAPELSVPRVLGYCQDGDLEYILMTRMAGVALRVARPEGDARREVLVALGRSLRRVHSLPIAPFDDSGLFPGDADSDAVRARLVDGLSQVAEVVAAQDAAAWPLRVAPQALAERALAPLGDGLPRVALHSNPGPEHVYVDPDRFAFRGLIDFGDAYVSHPAFDLRRWTAPDDRAALMRGYASEAPLSAGFEAAWLVVALGGVLAAIAGVGPGGNRPERREAALRDLPGLAAELLEGA
ncbi:MAG: aminoglycoside phosphotransferase family protein [Dehalococcoidia bacterium]